MYDICVMCDVCENCADSSRVTYVTHIACSARETSIAHIPHRICVTFESGAIRDSFAKRLFEQSEFGAPCLALVQPCRSAGVAPADGRRQPLPTSQEAPDLDTGSSIVLRTLSAPAKGEHGMLNSVCCVCPRPVRTISLVQVVFDESPPGTDGNRFESTPWTAGTTAAYGRSKFTSCNTTTPFFVFHEGRVRGSRSPNPKLAFRPWPLASSQPDWAGRAHGNPPGPRLRRPSHSAHRTGYK